MSTPVYKKLTLLIVFTQFLVLFPIIPKGVDYSLESCTIFSVTRDEWIFFCNNEDEGLRHGRVWFFPGTQDSHGLVLLGYQIYRDLMIPVGGINEHGLCIDGNMVPETQIALDLNKPDYEGSFFLDLLRTCKTVEEARNWVRSYDLLLLHWQQEHIADSTGDAVIISLNDEGYLWMTNKSNDYLVSTNFNPAQDDSEDHQCYRYETTINMLNSMSELTLDYCKDILEAVSNQATMYSNIYDFQTGLLHLYSRGDFSREAVLNITDELSKGEHSYDIEALVSQQSGQSDSFEASIDALGFLVIGCVIVFTITITALRYRRGRFDF
jgi:hypothetical protein